MSIHFRHLQSEEYKTLTVKCAFGIEMTILT